MKPKKNHVSCEEFKDPKVGKCYCQYLNRKWNRDLMLYKKQMRNLGKTIKV